MKSQLDSTHRFSNRVSNYIKYRPGYPDTVIELLKKRAGLAADSVVADIGSGTGISSELFLRNGNPVFAIEPNAQMRGAAETRLKKYSGFRSIDGSAETTTLMDDSVDFIVSAQAFHWFDAAAARKEFGRILKKTGKVVLIWNARRTESIEFLRVYETFLENFGTDYRQVNHRNIDEKVLGGFFSSVEKHIQYNEQVLTFEELKGRLLSSSYIPAEDDPGYEPMLEEIKRIFNRYNENGQVKLEYDVEIYFGTVF